MRYVLSLLLIITIVLIQYTSLNLFFFRYVDWLVIFSVAGYWIGYRSYTIIIAFSAAIIIDIITQNVAGISGAGIFVVLALFGVVDSFTRFDTAMSKFLFSELSLVFIIIITRLGAIFANSLSAVDITSKITEILTQILISAAILGLIMLINSSKHKNSYPRKL